MSSTLDPTLVEIKLFRFYCATNTKNGKRYAGQTYHTVAERWRKHVYDAVSGRDVRFSAAVRKHGAESFRIELLEEHFCTQLEADIIESRYIDEWNLMDKRYGYNMKSGGNTRGAVKMSPEASKKAADGKRRKLLMKRRFRTQEEDRPIVEAFKAGKSRNQIVTELGFTHAKVQKALFRWKERVEPDLVIRSDQGLTNKKRADELNQPVIDALLTGKSRKQVREELGMGFARLKQVVQRFRARCNEQGLEIPTALRDKTTDITSAIDARNAPIVELFSQGLKRRQIATKLGVSYDAVKCAIKRHRYRSRHNL